MSISPPSTQVQPRSQSQRSRSQPAQCEHSSTSRSARSPRPRSNRATCWRAAAYRRVSLGPRSKACRIGMAVSSITPRSAWPSTRSIPIPDVDRMLVVMNLYPLRARLPRNLAAVEDRMDELSFGNRLRQDHDTARRINALVETIDDLAVLVPPDALDERLRARLYEARRYKIIDAIVNIDMQDPAA